MRLDDQRESSNIEDRRGGGGFGGLGGGGIRIGRGGVAGGGIGVVVIALIAMFFGVDPGAILGGGAPAPQPGYTEQRAPVPRPQGAPGQTAQRVPGNDDAQARFVSQILASTEDVWTAEFRRAGREYPAPQLVLFSGAVNSGCGAAQSGMGPFYCPADRKVYLDTSFFREMEQRLGAPGDFARAYVIAHEVGHHVQNVLGLLPRAQQAQQQAGDRVEANQIQVRVELMADCLAGFWARRAEQMSRFLEPGDIEEGLGAAAAVGDDRLQKASRGQVVPESFTHGSSAQRVQWFRRGLAAENVQACDAFAAR
jgi:predicted metalloprotease